MTYSFHARGISKSDAILDLDDKVDKFVLRMPSHKVDKEMLLRHAREQLAHVADPFHDESVVIVCHGYIVNVSERTTTINCAISVHLVPRR